jgi:hypothetical protein
MPKLGDSLPKYRKKTIRGRVCAVVTLDGKDHYRGDDGTKASKRECDPMTNESLANGRRLKRVESSSLTITERISHYLRFAKTYYVKNGNSRICYPRLVHVVIELACHRWFRPPQARASIS